MYDRLVQYFKTMLDTPSAESLAFWELEECKRRLLLAQSAREYADSMCKYREAQIKRLTAYLHTATTEDK